MAATCPASVRGRRDKTVVLLGFALGARRHELAFLLLASVRFEDERGMVVTVVVSKTGPREVAVPYGENPDTCPVRAVKAWIADLETAGAADPGLPLFRSLHASGSILGGVTPETVGDWITAAGQRAGVAVRFTGHSVRSGLVTAARRAGKDAKAISATTGHRPNSSVLHGYMQTEDRWHEKDNALVGLL
ncbi:tyrosine-type recombinase/integrase [Kitasatospora sp. NPDC005751]|uniref:tyrosine-type recombinase/integrase n=1 Tax=Kitasatospora sp. NPDC005751 TaxID=3157064 RepID=UPI00340671BF